MKNRHCCTYTERFFFFFVLSIAFNLVYNSCAIVFPVQFSLFFFCFFFILFITIELFCLVWIHQRMKWISFHVKWKRKRKFLLEFHSYIRILFIEFAYRVLMQFLQNVATITIKSKQQNAFKLNYKLQTELKRMCNFCFRYKSILANNFINFFFPMENDIK